MQEIKSINSEKIEGKLKKKKSLAKIILMGFGLAVIGLFIGFSFVGYTEEKAEAQKEQE